MTSTPAIRLLAADDLGHHLLALSDILTCCVQAGASVGFILPFDQDAAASFWQGQVFPAVQRGEALLFGAFQRDSLVGTVQLRPAMPANQPHRADVGKLLVHPQARRAGIGRALMTALEAEACRLQKRLLLLDTRSGDPSQHLYESLGYRVAGSVPGFCLHPNGEAFESTTYLYKTLP